MLRTKPSASVRANCRQSDRRGNIIILSAVALVMMVGFTAFTVDIGFMMETRTQMQAAADGAVLAAALEMPNGWGYGKSLTATQVAANANSAATTVGTTYRVGEQAHAYIDSSRDVRFGTRSKSATGAWVETWNASPYNMVEVTVRRDQALAGNVASRADQRIPMFFAPVIGTKSSSIVTHATAVLAPGDGFKITTGSSSTCPLMPLAMDETTWNNLINSGVGSDSYMYNSNGTVTSGADGIKECNLYPEGTGSPGNRGTVDIGSSNNSTADISRQILYGPNASDLNYFSGSLRIPLNGSIVLNGDTGLSAAITDDLTAIIGKPRVIPIFRSVTGPGNNAMYTIVKFVGVRVMYAKLTGSPDDKKVWVQPCPVQHGTITRGTGALQPDSIIAPLQLVH